MKKKTLSIIVSMCMLLSIVFVAPLQVDAAAADDLIKVAEGELHNTDGSKYGEGAWCGHFIIWCANQANIPTSILPRLTTASAHVAHPNYRTRQNYSPKRGDIVILDTDSNGTANHMEIVTGVHSDGVYSIGGNTTIKCDVPQKGSNGVETKTRYNSMIVGYLVVNYDGSTPSPTPTPTPTPTEKPDIDITNDPVLTVKAGTTDTDTVFSWDAVDGATSYNLNILKGSCPDGEAYISKTNVSSGIEISLPAGNYYAYIDACNADFTEQKTSNIVPFEVEDTSDIISGTCGNNLTWTFNENTGALAITGTGNMWNWEGWMWYYDPAPWYSVNHLIKTVNIADGVTSIGEYAFPTCHYLTSITIPDSVTGIGELAFFSCDSLTSITIPDGVTSIGDKTFGGCTSLTNITIPDSVKSIGDEAFLGCASLTNITIDGVESIGSEAFRGCASLTSITIPDGVTSIRSNTFAGCKSLTSITIPDSVEDIWSGAFWNCASLTSITIPDGVTSIRSNTFAGCESLTSITIPDSVKIIENGYYGGAFRGCARLTDVYYGGSEAEWKQIEIESDNEELTSATIHFMGETESDTEETEQEREYVSGDVNNDNSVDVRDVVSLRRHIVGGYEITVNEKAVDVNRDNAVDIRDVIVLRRFIAGGYGVELR